MAHQALAPATALGEQLTALGYKQQGTRRNWRHARIRDRKTMSWGHDLLGDIVIGIDGFDVSESESVDGYSWARVLTRSKEPGNLTLTFNANLLNNVHYVFQARGNEVVQCTGNIPPLKVPVSWDSRTGRPSTRVKDKDNLDHFIVTEDGILLQLQTSILTRDDTFYVGQHELWAGRIVEVTEENPSYKVHEVDGRRYAVEPFWDTQAYPGADFLLTNGTTGPKVIELAIREGLEVTVARTLDIPSWDPPAFPSEDGSGGAVVLWFNPNVGAKVLDADDQQHFVMLKGILHADGSQVMRGGGFPLVVPKQQVFLGSGNDGQKDFVTIRPAT